MHNKLPADRRAAVEAPLATPATRRTASQWWRAAWLGLLAGGACLAGGPAQAACRAGEPSFFRDEGLTMKVTTKLQFTKALMREKIHVKVTGGVATLSGGISSAEQIETAVRVARQVEGIHCVNNFMKVGPSETDGARGVQP